MRKLLWAIVGACLPFGAAPAQETGPPPAVGEITYEPAKPGAAVCTGTLVAADLVLTASHCLRHHEGGPSLDPATITFSAGRNGDTWLAQSVGSAISFPQTVPMGEPAMAGDLGLLRLATPITGKGVTPLPFADPGDARLLAMVSYRHDDPHKPEFEPDCGILSASLGLFALTCPAVSGNSGAPLLVAHDGGWAIAGVMVAAERGIGLVGSYAARPRLGLRTAVATPPSP